MRTTDAGVNPGTASSGSDGDIALNAFDDIILYADGDVFLKAGDGVSITNESVADQTALVVNNTDASDLTKYILKLQSAGVNQVHVNNQGDLTALGEIKCANFQMTSGAAAGTFLVSDGDGDATWTDWSDSSISWGNITSSSFGFTATSSGGDIMLLANDDIFIGQDPGATDFSESVRITADGAGGDGLIRLRSYRPSSEGGNFQGIITLK